MAKDRHDPRDFERFVKLNDDGTVAAVTMIEVGAPERRDAVLLKVDHLGAIALDDVTVDPELVVTIKAKREARDTAAAAYALALSEQAIAEQTTIDAFSVNARKPKNG